MSRVLVLILLSLGVFGCTHNQINQSRKPASIPSCSGISPEVMKQFESNLMEEIDNIEQRAFSQNRNLSPSEARNHAVYRSDLQKCRAEYTGFGLPPSPDSIRAQCEYATQVNLPAIPQCNTTPSQQIETSLKLRIDAIEQCAFAKGTKLTPDQWDLDSRLRDALKSCRN